MGVKVSGPCMVVVCGMFAGCMQVSKAELALWRLRAARQVIHEVHAQREAAKEFVPIEQRVCETLGSFDEVAACECVISPTTQQTQTENSDKSISYGEETELRCFVLITLKTAKLWNEARAQSEVAALLRDNGLKDFTLYPPVQSGTTWVVTGHGPFQSLPQR